MANGGIAESLVESLREEVPSLYNFLFNHDSDGIPFYTGKSMIAGGWVTCKLADIKTPDGDIDFFFETEDEYKNFVAQMIKFVGTAGNNRLYESAFALSLTLNQKKIQLIRCNFIPHQKVLDNFDIVPCCVGIAINGDNKHVDFLASPQSLHCIEHMRLMYTPSLIEQVLSYQDAKEIPNTVYFDITFERTIKYIKRGFDMTDGASKVFNLLIRTASRQTHSGADLQVAKRVRHRADGTAYTTIGTRAVLFHNGATEIVKNVDLDPEALNFPF